MIGSKIIYKANLESTNNYVATLIKKGEIKHGTVILAGSQTRGKGQRGSIWDSEANKNILFSCYLKHDNLAVNLQVLMIFYVAIVIQDFLKKFNIQSSIKWPNDIVVTNKKIAGILIENSFENLQIKHSIIGVGINVNQIDFGNYNATSFKIQTHKEHSILDLSQVLIETFNKYLILLEQKKYTILKQKYLDNLWLYNQESDFQTENEIFTGKIIDVNENGELIVVKGSEMRNYKNKEIFFLERFK